jgi:hypothetical protein
MTRLRSFADRAFTALSIDGAGIPIYIDTKTTEPTCKLVFCISFRIIIAQGFALYSYLVWVYYLALRTFSSTTGRFL